MKLDMDLIDRLVNEYCPIDPEIEGTEEYREALLTRSDYRAGILRGLRLAAQIAEDEIRDKDKSH